jgi:Zn-dependent protease with chaperone function
MSTSSTISPDQQLRRATAMAWAAVGLVIGAIGGLILAGFVGLVIGAILLTAGFGAIGAVLVARFVESALDRTVSKVSTSPTSADDAPRLFNLLHGLCGTAGVALPNVSVVETSGINAMVAADPSRDRTSELIVTRGFVEDLERIEMEGAVAVCLARLRSGLAEAQTLAVALSVGAPWWIPGVARRRTVADATVDQAVFDADVKGVGITRYPPGLAAAFQRMLSVSTRVENVDLRTAPLWLANPVGESEALRGTVDNDALGTASGSRVGAGNEDHPPLVERLALLREI